MEYPIEFAFLRGGCGWNAECLNDPESPPLAARLAKEFWKWAEIE